MKIQNAIVSKLETALSPEHLEVINESHMHSVPANSETHFKVVIVSDKFDGETLVARHRRINTLLAAELAGGVHALGLHTLTGAEWAKKGGSVAVSPKCLGGSQVDQGQR